MLKVFVALSGGVDSSVAALLLKKGGFSITGVYMRLSDNYKEGEKMARTVAKKLKIRFFVFDLRKEFKKRVIDYFLKQTKAGLTPNPCVICNEEIKFGLFLKKSLETGADLIATGHYARIRDTRYKIQDTRYTLLKARDRNKDQSYFLWRLRQKQLSRVIFPLGNYAKPQVREIAKKAGLPTAMAKESQDLCFLKNDIASFLKKHLKMKPGLIVDNEGKAIGKHLGLGFYTIGQSRGFGSDIFPENQSQGPYYVLMKEIRKDRLIVTKDKKDLLGRECLIEEINWISGRMPVLPLKVNVKIRSQQKEVPAVISKTKKTNQFLIKFAKPQLAITPGQSAVFYKGRELLGGGIIN